MQKLVGYVYVGLMALAKPGSCNGGEGGVENDITFDHTMYIGVDPESFGGVDAILNQFEC